MALYALNEDVQQQLKLERFEGEDFSAREFIESISSSQAHAMAENELDPKPYIRTFEAVAKEMEKLLDRAQRREASEKRKTTELEEAHNWNVIDMAGNIDDGMNSIRNLDTQVTDISRATAQMSEQLSRLSQQHKSVISMRQLIQYYVSFQSKGDCPELLRLWNSEDPDDHRRCVNAVGGLQLLAQKLNDQATEDIINKFAEDLELYLIGLFQDAYTAFDLVGMRGIAQVLFDFNHGSSVVQVFVNQHAFFMQVDRIEDDTALRNSEIWNSLADPAADTFEFEAVFSKLIDEVTDTVVNETDVITRVFPKPTQVLSVFMQRLFAQYIQGQVLLYIQEAENRSPLAQARVLNICYRKLSLMVKNLKDSWHKQKIDPEGELGANLDSNFADIFTISVNDRYFSDIEIPILTEVCNTAFSAFHRIHKVQADRNSQRYFRDSNPLDDVASPASTSNGLPASEGEDMSAMDKFFRVVRTSGNTLAGSKNFRSAGASPDGQLQLKDLKLVLSSLAESVGRVQVLRPQSETVADGTVLFNFIMANIGGRYINVAFDDAIERTNQDLKSDIDWQFLETVRQASNAVHIVSAFIKSVLFAMVQPSDTRLAEMADNINQYVTSTQEQCSYILERGIDLYRTHLQHIFYNQRKRDLAPRDTDTIELDQPSAVAAKVVSLLEAAYTQVDKSLVGPNRDNYLLSLAQGLHAEILEHLKKNPINPVGARILENDIAEYERVILNDWQADAHDHFATLRALAKIFSTDAKMLPTLLRDGRLARFKPSVLRDYVKMRPDFQSRGLNLLFLGYRSSYLYN